MKKKKTLKIIVIVLLCLLGLTLLDLNNQKNVKKLSLNEVNLSQIKDGIYFGEYKKYRWEYKVKVEIKDSKIIDIKVEDKPVSSYDNKVITKVIDDQKIDIDTVSGATINDKTLLKSIESALNK